MPTLVASRPATPAAPDRITPAAAATGTWTVILDPPHREQDNEGRIALAEGDREAGFLLFIDCADDSVWIDTIRVVPGLRGNGLGTRLLTLALDLHPGRTIGLAAPTAALAAWYGRFGFVPAGPDGVLRRTAPR
ncbi:GNAT family N-acetyltransferase [Amycolatopsis sp. cg9]|uniref:GNAT family N-acetyltransferase n=1 Tax=Amycolatopsis sp. cg9 TaxID=3238801 RepID=UPI0035254860